MEKIRRTIAIKRKAGKIVPRQYMSGDFNQLMDIASKFATVGVYIFTGITLGLHFGEQEKPEQIRIANVINKDLTEIGQRY